MSAHGAKAHGEGQVPLEESSDLQGRVQAQPGRADPSRGSRDGSEAGIGNEWDVCNPAAPDAACSITIASTARSGMRLTAGADRGKLPSPHTHTAVFSQGMRLEGAGSVLRPSVSPAYSMLPWDKPGIWPAVGDSMHNRDPQASVHPSTAALAVPGAALSAPMTLTGQPSRLGVTVAGPLQQASIPEGLRPHARPFSLPTIHDRGQPAYISEVASAEHRRHDSTDAWADLPGSIGSTNSLWAGDRPHPLPEIASAEHGQHGITAPADLLSSVHLRRAQSPNDSPAEVHQEHLRVSRRSWEAASQGHMTGPLRNSHMALPAQRNAAVQMLEQGPGHTGLMESAGQAMAWGRAVSRTSCDGGSAEAEMQSAHHWLGMHGYSDAAVHVTANLAELRPPPGTAEADGKHVMDPSPMGAPPPASRKLAGGLSGAIWHSSSPSSFSSSSSRKEVGPAVEAPSHFQRHASHVWQGTASSGTGSAIDSAVSAAGVAQKPINVQGVALNRTMPSIWDLDM